MSLKALAPDQRAVVQLVLQQGRSYDDLAGLLGISTDAVRARAHAGLAKIGGDGGLGESDRATLSDYLLGQQTVSQREASRSLLADSADARRWARTVADELEEVSREPLPVIPDEDDDDAAAVPAAAEADDPGDEIDEIEDPEPVSVSKPTAARAPQDDDDGDEPTAEKPAAEKKPVVAAKPRPRPSSEPARAERKRPGGAKPSSSRLGGLLLILGVALLLAIAIIFLFTRGDDEGSGGEEQAATPTATATGTPQPLAEIPLASPSKAKAKGSMRLFNAEGALVFTIEATDVPASKEGEAYAVWLLNPGKNAKRLGFAQPVTGEGENAGRLGLSGPREQDLQRFPQDITKYRQVVVSRETSQDTKTPGPIILRGQLRQGG